MQTTELLTKPVPFTVSVNPALPTITLAGVMLFREGVGFNTGKKVGDVVPPPGAGFETVTENAPVLATSAADIWAVNCVVLTKLVVRLPPLKRIFELLLKFVPLTVSVNAPPPKIAVDGESAAIVGAGLFIAKSLGAVAIPPGLTIVTGTIPAA